MRGVGGDRGVVTVVMGDGDVKSVGGDRAMVVVADFCLIFSLLQKPFRRLKGSVQKVAFHPSKPYFFVAVSLWLTVSSSSDNSRCSLFHIYILTPCACCRLRRPFVCMTWLRRS